MHLWLTVMVHTMLSLRNLPYVCLLACSTSKKKLGCNAQLIVDEFGEKLLEELDYLQEARNIQVQHCHCLHYIRTLIGVLLFNSHTNHHGMQTRTLLP